MGNVTVALNRRGGIAAASTGRLATITMSASYATNGDSFTLAQFEMGVIDAIFFSGSAGYQFEADLPNKKIKVRQGDNTNVAAAPGIEVPNATNLSAVTVRALVFGDNSNV